MADANEAIYDALNENNIEIPFPQTDVHIRDINASFASAIEEAKKEDKA